MPPLYDYKCECGWSSELLVRYEDKVLCPDCLKEASRQMSKTAPPVFVGKGFYATDYPKKDKK